MLDFVELCLIDSEIIEASCLVGLEGSLKLPLDKANGLVDFRELLIFYVLNPKLFVFEWETFFQLCVYCFAASVSEFGRIGIANQTHLWFRIWQNRCL